MQDLFSYLRVVSAMCVYAEYNKRRQNLAKLSTSRVIKEVYEDTDPLFIKRRRFGLALALAIL
jgi:hypothetical protein